MQIGDDALYDGRLFAQRVYVWGIYAFCADVFQGY